MEPDSRSALESLAFPEGTVRQWAFDVPIELLAKVSGVTLVLPFPKMALPRLNASLGKAETR